MEQCQYYEINSLIKFCAENCVSGAVTNNSVTIGVTN